MVRHYCSFLVRCWYLADGQRRVRVEHVQTGEVLHAATLDAALAWMDARAMSAAGDAVGNPPSTPPSGQAAADPQAEA